MTSTLRPVRAGAADPLLTIEQAAAQLQIAPGTLKHWVAWRKVEHVKVGKLTRIRQSALDRYVAAQTVAAVVEE